MEFKTHQLRHDRHQRRAASSYFFSTPVSVQKVQNPLARRRGPSPHFLVGLVFSVSTLLTFLPFPLAFPFDGLVPLAALPALPLPFSFVLPSLAGALPLLFLGSMVSLSLSPSRRRSRSSSLRSSSLAPPNLGLGLLLWSLPSSTPPPGPLRASARFQCATATMKQRFLFH